MKKNLIPGGFPLGQGKGKGRKKNQVIDLQQRQQLKSQLENLEVRRLHLEGQIEKDMQVNTMKVLEALGVENVTTDHPAYQAFVCLYGAICANVLNHQELNAIRQHQQKINTLLHGNPNGKQKVE